MNSLTILKNIPQKITNNVEFTKNCEKYFTKTTKNDEFTENCGQYFTKITKNVEFTHWSVEKKRNLPGSGEGLCGNQGNVLNFLQNVSKFKEFTHIF